MNVGADETQRTLTWYSPVSETISVQLAPVSELEDGLMPMDALTLSAEPMSCSIEGRSLFRATLTGLQENTEYAYRIGSDTAGLDRAAHIRHRQLRGLLLPLRRRPADRGQR